MNTEPKTIEEFRLAIAALKLAHQTEMAAVAASAAKLKQDVLDAESRNADLESMLGRYKSKFGSLNSEIRPAFTRPDYGGGR
jgi:hypothetical protein